VKSSLQFSGIVEGRWQHLPPTNKTGRYKNPAEEEAMHADIAMNPVMRQYRQAGK